MIVSTSDPGRARGWTEFLEEACLLCGEAKLRAEVVATDEVRTGLRDLVERTAVEGLSECPPTPIAPLSHRETERRSGPVPEVVDKGLRAATATQAGRSAFCAAALSGADRALLDQVARHPFLTAQDLALVLDAEKSEVEESSEQLIRLDFLRAATEIPGGLTLVEATVDGLRVVAAQHGFSLAYAVRHLGLVGGGPGQPLGSRDKLVANLAHTRGSDRVVVGLAATLKWVREIGGDGALLEWRNAAVCSRRHARPDGYGLIRYDGERYGFFLAYDRGTMRFRDYLEKLDAYYAFRDTGRFERDYLGFPTILFVTSGGRAAEERIARAARQAAIGRSYPLDLLITGRWRIDDPTNRCGFLGPIWRSPGEGYAARRSCAFRERRQPRALA